MKAQDKTIKQQGEQFADKAQRLSRATKTLQKKLPLRWDFKGERKEGDLTLLSAVHGI